MALPVRNNFSLLPHNETAFFFHAETNEARNAFNEADSKLKSLVNQKKDDEEELIELFDVEGFGRQGEWKKLQDLCLSLEAGELVLCGRYFTAKN